MHRCTSTCSCTSTCLLPYHRLTLRHALFPAIESRFSGSTRVYCFANEPLKAVVIKKYLTSAELRKQTHFIMSHYFVGLCDEQLPAGVGRAQLPTGPDGTANIRRLLEGPFHMVRAVYLMEVFLII
jgi:hypothetical protein